MTILSKPIVFIDTETGGLDPARCALVEVAWATLDDPEPKTLTLPHDPAKVEPIAAKVNQYYERGLDKPESWANEQDIELFLADLNGVTLCGANVAFDAAFIQTHLAPNGVPWHYRTLDIESMAYGILRTPDVPGMKGIYDELTTRGYDVPAPNHTAAGDVRTLVAAYKILRYL